MKCLTKYLFAGLLLSGLNCDVVWAQTGSTPQISGTARNQSGAVLPRVDITTTHPRLKITIRNYAHVESETLIRAEQEATRIYHEIGVETVWLAQPLLTGKEQEDSPRSQGSNMDLIILAHKMAENLGAQSSSLGLAPGAGRHRDWAYLFYDRVEDLSRRQILAAAQGKVHRWATTAQILGYAIAHEVRHLLGVSHSTTGIMREGWRWNDLQDAAYGDLDFTPQQAAVIRTEVRIRESPETFCERSECKPDRAQRSRVDEISSFFF